MSLQKINNSNFIPIPHIWNDPCKVVAKFLTVVEVLRLCSSHNGGQLWAIDALEKRLPKVYIRPPGMLFDIFKREIALLQDCQFHMTIPSQSVPIRVQIKPHVLANAVDRRVSQQEREQLSALLGHAVKQQAEICVRLMIGCGVDVNTPSENDMRSRCRYPLIEAADRNDNEMVRLLLQSRADPKVSERVVRVYPRTSLLLALRQNNGEMVSDLLDAGMPMTDEIRNLNRDNYLHYVDSIEVLVVVHDKLSKGNLDSYKALLKKTNSNGKTPVERWQRFLNFNDSRLEALKRDLQNWGIL